MHCKIISSKLLENLFHIAKIYQYSILQLNHQKYLRKLVPFEPCRNMLDCFTYINISHLYRRVNLITLTKFHCLNCTIIVGKNYLCRNLFLWVSRDCYRNIHNFTFITFKPLLFFAWEKLVYPERWNFTFRRASNMWSESWNCSKWFSDKIINFIFPIFLTPWILKIWSKYYWIIYQILLKPKKYVCL